MYIKIEFGENLSEGIMKFCDKCEDRYNLGSQLHDAFGIDIESIMKSAFSTGAQNLKIFVETEKTDGQT